MKGLRVDGWPWVLGLTVVQFFFSRDVFLPVLIFGLPSIFMEIRRMIVPFPAFVLWYHMQSTNMGLALCSSVLDVGRLQYFNFTLHPRGARSHPAL